jgi:hypothetical protein
MGVYEWAWFQVGDLIVQCGVLEEKRICRKSCLQVFELSAQFLILALERLVVRGDGIHSRNLLSQLHRWHRLTTASLASSGDANQFEKNMTAPLF